MNRVSKSGIVVMSGPPGTGKTAVAEALGRALPAPVFAKDWLEAPLLASGLVSRDQRGIPGWPELEWSEVERVRGYFAPWQQERLVLDAALPLDGNIERAPAYVGDVRDVHDARDVRDVRDASAPSRAES